MAEISRPVILERLERYFAERREIDWVRSKIHDPGHAARVELLVAPVAESWSQLEQVAMKADLKALLGCPVELRDERTHFFRSLDELAAWTLLKAGNVARRLDVEHMYRQDALWREHAARGLSEGFVRDLASPERLSDTDKAFARILQFVEEWELYGDALPPEPGAVSNSAQEAAEEALRLCCEIRYVLSRGQPETIRDAFAFLVTQELLPDDCAVRLAEFVQWALPHYFDSASLTSARRVSALLAVRDTDLAALSKAATAAAGRCSTPSVEASSSTAPAPTAGPRLEELLSQTRDPSERDVLEDLRTSVFRRVSRMNREGESLGAYLVYSDVPMRSEFPKELAEALFGDSTFVYDITAVLEADVPRRRTDAVWGRSRRLAPASECSLPQFVERHGRGVIVFDQADRYEPDHMARLAILIDGELRGPDGEKTDSRNLCILVWGQFAVGSPEELGFSVIPGEARGSDTAWDFERAVRVSSSARAERVSDRIQDRFTLCLSGLWQTLRSRVAAGNISEPLLHQRPELNPAPARLPATAPHVPDIAGLPTISPQPGRFEFFVSYSWKRTESEAHALAAALGEKRVFLDRKRIKPDETMDKLIPEIIAAVRSSEAVVIFPILLGEPLPDLEGGQRADALKRGLAQNVPAVGGTFVAEWSWQTLELQASSHYLVIGERLAKAFVGDRADPEFIPRSCASLAERVAACEAYLAHRREASPWRGHGR